MLKPAHILLSLACLSPLFACADILVIVNPANNSELTQKQIKKIFLGKSQRFSDGSRAIAIDLDPGNNTRDQFYQVLAKKSAAQLKVYWSQLIFSGKATPPKAIGNGSDVVALIASNPNLIGYVDSSDVNDQVKAVATFQ